MKLTVTISTFKNKWKLIGKTPATKLLLSNWIPDGDDAPSINVNDKKITRQFMKIISNQSIDRALASS